MGRLIEDPRVVSDANLFAEHKVEAADPVNENDYEQDQVDDSKEEGILGASLYFEATLKEPIDAQESIGAKDCARVCEIDDGEQIEWQNAQNVHFKLDRLDIDQSQLLTISQQKTLLEKTLIFDPDEMRAVVMREE